MELVPFSDTPTSRSCAWVGGVVVEVLVSQAGRSTPVPWSLEWVESNHYSRRLVPRESTGPTALADFGSFYPACVERSCLLKLFHAPLKFRLSILSGYVTTDDLQRIPQNSCSPQIVQTSDFLVC